MSMKEKNIMIGRVQDWVGSDATMSDLMDIIAQVAIGSYSAKQLKDDILSFEL